MAGAAGGFVTRSFESMLKESKKHIALQKAIQAYLDCTKETNQHDLPTEKNEIVSVPVAPESGSAGGIEQGENLGNQQSVSTSEEGEIANVESIETSMPVTTALASAGNTLEGSQSELLLQPLRLAFDTKNAKLLESALDCLHKLIAYDHLEGDPGLEGGKNAPLFTDILNMVCNCVDNSSSDSTILQVLKVLLTAVASAKFRVHGESLLGVIRVCYNIALNSKSPINQATSKAMLTQMINITFRRMESDQTLTSSPVDPLHIDSTSGNNGEITMGVQDDKTITPGDALSNNQEKEESHTSVEEIQNLAGGADIKGLEAVLDKAVNLEGGEKISRGINLDSMSVGEHDALLLFRTLCKMGMKEENDDVTVKTRNLSLELLQGLLEGVSHSFTKNFHFIDSVKAYLSYALLRACVSSSPSVFQYAAGIFAILLLRFRESLKGEIGVFFPLIVLRSLDSFDSPLSQRTSVLRMLEKVCKDPQMLADIFVNYDCALDAPNLFERMVNALSRMSQGLMNVDPNSSVASQTASIKSSSLQCLVSVLKSLVDWEKHQRESVDITSLPLEEEVSSKESTIDESKQLEEGPSQFEKAKAHKSTLEASISEFNRKPSKGIDILISNKLVENTATSVAQFLKNTPTLDKGLIGEYFGQHEEFPISVMHAYVDSMNFIGLNFDSAIREFLDSFRLPGEAQKIDRIMEKFAERYCADNPKLFKNADTAYVLAYAVIMLNTDAHNPMVWPKMTKSEFVRMTTVSEGEECLAKELLEEIYDSILKDEIKMKNDVTDGHKHNKQKPNANDMGSLINILNLALPRRKSSLDIKTESEQIVRQTQTLFTKQGAKRGVFYTAKQVELVRPMLEAVGWPLLAAFSVIMEEEENKARAILCMEGFKFVIHITCILGMYTMRYAFLTSLVRLTFLHAPKQMRGKNVEALRTLLVLCNTEMDSLQDTWNAVLECMSRLDFIISTPSISSSVMQGSNQISRDSVLQSLKELYGKHTDQVFLNSVKLPSDSVVEFFNALCGVSAEELKQTPARVFSLQKLVEISYYNMARIRLVWARIWSVLAHHFITAGSHHDEKIAMYAIDSLRQLGMKYLEHAELTNFTFQNDILKPFVILMRNSRSELVRTLIVDCIVQMIRSKVGNIKSGWKSVFMIFTAASDDNIESIIESAFENVEQVILEHFDQVVGDCFMDCVNCLIGFANNKTSPRISLKAIALLRICEDRLAEGLIPGGALKPVDDGLDATFHVTEHYWFPMLAGLSDLTLDSRVEVRNCALEVLFDLLNERGRKFSSAFWENVFHRVLFPIFDHVRHAERNSFGSSVDEWLRDTIIHSLQLLCNLFNTFYKDVSFMLPQLLSLLLDCAKKTDQSVVSISLGALVHLIEVGGHQFSIVDWDTLLKSIRDASYTTQPLELLNSVGFVNLKGHAVQTADEYVNRSDSPSIKSIHPGSKDSETMFDRDSFDIQKDFDSSTFENSTDVKFQTNLKESEGSAPKASEPESENLQRNQTFGQRVMGNMMDNIFLRSFASKPKIQSEDVSTPSSPLKVSDAVELSLKDEEEGNPLLETIRGKCITQLLLLGVLDSIQRKYWSRLTSPQKISIMEVLLSVLDFASSFNSHGNLRMRMHQIPSGRPPLNLLRQEMKGTSIYLDILQKTTTGHDTEEAKHDDNDGNTTTGHDTEEAKHDDNDGNTTTNSIISTHSDEVSKDDKNLKVIAEEKTVSFCEQILKDASELHSNTGVSVSVDIHRVLEMRAPVIIKVLKGMCSMDSQLFKRHLSLFYPLITKLVCCDQMDVRGALADLFDKQLTPLLP